MQTIFPHLWAKTTSVRQASTGTLVEMFSGLTGTPSGTDRGVVPLAPVVSSTHVPPWFNIQLSAPTTDYIEVRICGDTGNYGEYAENTVDSG